MCAGVRCDYCIVDVVYVMRVKKCTNLRIEMLL